MIDDDAKIYNWFTARHTPHSRMKKLAINEFRLLQKNEVGFSPSPPRILWHMEIWRDPLNLN